MAEAILLKLSPRDYTGTARLIVENALEKNEPEIAKRFARKILSPPDHDAAFYSIFRYYLKRREIRLAQEAVNEFILPANQNTAMQMLSTQQPVAHRPRPPGDVTFIEDDYVHAQPVHAQVHVRPLEEEEFLGDFMTDEQFDRLIKKSAGEGSHSRPFQN